MIAGNLDARVSSELSSRTLLLRLRAEPPLTPRSYAPETGREKRIEAIRERRGLRVSGKSVSSCIGSKNSRFIKMIIASLSKWLWVRYYMDYEAFDSLCRRYF